VNRFATPPGPAKPFDGSQDLLDWLGEQIERYGDIVKASAFGGDIYIVNDPKYVQHVLRKNWSNYRKGLATKKVGMLIGKGLMVSEGDHWIGQRKLVQPAFSMNVIRAMASYMQTSSRDLCDAWERHAERDEPINITHEISRNVLSIVLLTLFGEDYEFAERHFRILSDDTGRNMEFAQTFRGLRAVVAEIVATRRSRGGVSQDLVGLLLETRGADGSPAMNDGQLISEIMTLVVAGHETTATTLNWVWYLLSQHPEVEERLQLEVEPAQESSDDGPMDLTGLDYTRRVIEETMRLYPAGWLLTRRAIEDDQLGDYRIPARSEIYISPYFLQRNPAYWPDPERFDPDRFDPARAGVRPELAMLAFSAGPRNCIGQQYARLKMQLHVATIARRLKLRFLGSTTPAMEAGINLRSREDLWMKAIVKSERAAAR
jgi:cytochrome P450